MIPLETILHPTDFSESSGYALQLTSVLAQNQSARVLLLHVLPRPGLVGRDSNVPAFKDMHTSEDLSAYRQEMAGLLAKVREKTPCARVESLLKEGPVAEVIARTAEETSCDLIVMGTHGRSGTNESLMGSVAGAVTRNAPCPVVTVKGPRSQS